MNDKDRREINECVEMIIARARYAASVADDSGNTDIAQQLRRVAFLAGVADNDAMRACCGVAE